jgi:predicted PP-loop superfamily ATPase
VLLERELVQSADCAIESLLARHDSRSRIWARKAGDARWNRAKLREVEQSNVARSGAYDSGAQHDQYAGRS